MNLIKAYRGWHAPVGETPSVSGDVMLIHEAYVVGFTQEHAGIIRVHATCSVANDRFMLGNVESDGLVTVKSGNSLQEVL